MNLLRKNQTVNNLSKTVFWGNKLIIYAQRFMKFTYFWLWGACVFICYIKWKKLVHTNFKTFNAARYCNDCFHKWNKNFFFTYLPFINRVWIRHWVLMRLLIQRLNICFKLHAVARCAFVFTVVLISRISPEIHLITLIANTW